MDWLTSAANWAKLSTTAGLGVIHSGHLAQARRRGRNSIHYTLLPPASGDGGAQLSQPTSATRFQALRVGRKRYIFFI